MSGISFDPRKGDNDSGRGGGLTAQNATLCLGHDGTALVKRNMNVKGKVEIPEMLI